MLRGVCRLEIKVPHERSFSSDILFFCKYPHEGNEICKKEITSDFIITKSPLYVTVFAQDYIQYKKSILNIHNVCILIIDFTVSLSMSHTFCSMFFCQLGVQAYIDPFINCFNCTNTSKLVHQ